MHDITHLDEHGIPGAFVASQEFEKAAQAQCESLGLTVPAVFVPHPIQDRTDAEMRALADGAAEAVAEALAGSSART